MSIIKYYKGATVRSDLISQALDASLATLQTHPLLSTKITRIEVIGLDGRMFSHKLDQSSYYKLSLQDDGRTLKLFKTMKE